MMCTLLQVAACERAAPSRRGCQCDCRERQGHPHEAPHLCAAQHKGSLGAALRLGSTQSPPSHFRVLNQQCLAKPFC